MVQDVGPEPGRHLSHGLPPPTPNAHSKFGDVAACARRAHRGRRTCCSSASTASMPQPPCLCPACSLFDVKSRCIGNREFTPPPSTLRASLELQRALTRFGGLTHSTSRLFDARAQPPQPHASLHSLHASASMPVLPLPPRLQPPCLRRLMNHACAASAVALRCGRALNLVGQPDTCGLRSHPLCALSPFSTPACSAEQRLGSQTQVPSSARGSVGTR